MAPQYIPAHRYIWSQSATPQSNSQGLWLQYVGDHPITAQYKLHLEALISRTGSNYAPDFLLLRPGVRRTIHRDLSVMLAYGYFEAYTERTGSTLNLQEHRLMQELLWTHGLAKVSPSSLAITQRFRYEERFRSLVGLPNRDWSLAQRARYLLLARVTVPWRQVSGRPAYFNVYNEVFVNTDPPNGRHTFDQSQSGASVGWHLRSMAELEFGYMHGYLADPNGQIGSHQHVLRLTLISRKPFKRR